LAEVPKVWHKAVIIKNTLLAFMCYKTKKKLSVKKSTRMSSVHALVWIVVKKKPYGNLIQMLIGVCFANA